MCVLVLIFQPNHGTMVSSYSYPHVCIPIRVRYAWKITLKVARAPYLVVYHSTEFGAVTALV